MGVRGIAVLGSLVVAAGCTGMIGERSLEQLEEVHSGPVTCDEPAPPGRVTMRRLNRNEYANTLRDLVGVVPPRVWTLPEDDSSAGFDRIGEVLTMTSTHAELYLTIASEALTSALSTPTRLLPCQPSSLDDATCFTTIARTVGRKAWRRPLAQEELQLLDEIRVLAKAEAVPVMDGVQALLEALLASPHFLYRVEVNGASDEETEALGAFELASRLSYFVWSSMPDETLLAAAEAGRLRTREDVDREVRRMLRDPKADALVTDFADQWLTLRQLGAVEPDASLYPGFDEALRAAMRDESRALFAKILDENGDVRDLVRSSETWVNARLAQHYKVTAPAGGGFVALPAGRAPGLLGHASMLALASHPNRTSPVKRGKLVLDTFLCAPPPPPPPDVEGLDAAVDTTAPIREQLETHRSKPECAQCHASMDPIGFAFEGFDAVGLARSKDDYGHPVDVGGELPTGEAFSGPTELTEILANDPRFVSCATKHLLTFATGRVMRGKDQCAADALADQVATRGYGLEDLIVLVAASDAMRLRDTDDGSTL